MLGGESEGCWQSDEDAGEEAVGGARLQPAQDAEARQQWPRVWAGPAAEDRGRWPTPRAKPLLALITVVDGALQRMFTRTFDVSPVRIGSHRTCDLRLPHPRVARWHGEISFEPDCVFFRNHAWTKPTSVDDRPLARGEAVTLSEESVIAMGCFRIDVCLRRARIRDHERARKVTPLFVLPWP